MLCCVAVRCWVYGDWGGLAFEWQCTSCTLCHLSTSVVSLHVGDISFCLTTPSARYEMRLCDGWVCGRIGVRVWVWEMCVWKACWMLAKHAWCCLPLLSGQWISCVWAVFILETERGQGNTLDRVLTKMLSVRCVCGCLYRKIPSTCMCVFICLCCVSTCRAHLKNAVVHQAAVLNTHPAFCSGHCSMVQILQFQRFVIDTEIISSNILLKSVAQNGTVWSWRRERSRVVHRHLAVI